MAHQTEQFKDNVVLVTGGGSGIGAATARLISARGGRVALLDQNGDALEQAASVIRGEGGDALALVADVTAASEVAAAVEEAVRRFGRLDGAVNNAGIAGPAFTPTADIDYDDWKRVVDVNLSSVFLCMQAEIPAILASGGGSIVNVSSVHADKYGPDSAYSSAKHGIRGMTVTAAREYGAKGLRVNEIQPGPTKTAMTAGNIEGTERVLREMGVPLGRMAEPEETARAIAFLLSDEASFITGVHLPVDGGLLL